MWSQLTNLLWEMWIQNPSNPFTIWDGVLNWWEEYLSLISHTLNIKFPHLLQFASTFYIHEDIQRRNLTRQGKICWHLRDEVGKSAFNDIFLIQAIMHNVIDRHFKGKKVHKYIVALFHKCFLNTKLGQSMDGRLGSVKGFSKFTMDNYKALTKYKVGYFFFFLPIALGKILVWKVLLFPRVALQDSNLSFRAMMRIQLQKRSKSLKISP